MSDLDRRVWDAKDRVTRALLQGATDQRDSARRHARAWKELARLKRGIAAHNFRTGESCLTELEETLTERDALRAKVAELETVVSLQDQEIAKGVADCQARNARIADLESRAAAPSAASSATPVVAVRFDEPAMPSEQWDVTVNNLRISYHPTEEEAERIASHIRYAFTIAKDVGPSSPPAPSAGVPPEVTVERVGAAGQHLLIGGEFVAKTVPGFDHDDIYELRDNIIDALAALWPSSPPADAGDTELREDLKWSERSRENLAYGLQKRVQEVRHLQKALERSRSCRRRLHALKQELTTIRPVFDAFVWWVAHGGRLAQLQVVLDLLDAHLAAKDSRKENDNVERDDGIRTREGDTEGRQESEPRPLGVSGQLVGGLGEGRVVPVRGPVGAHGDSRGEDPSSPEYEEGRAEPSSSGLGSHEGAGEQLLTPPAPWVPRAKVGDRVRVPDGRTGEVVKLGHPHDPPFIYLVSGTDPYHYGWHSSVEPLPPEPAAKDYGTNAGTKCDTNDGPCACGAWHKPEPAAERTEQEKRWADEFARERVDVVEPAKPDVGGELVRVEPAALPDGRDVTVGGRVFFVDRPIATAERIAAELSEIISAHVSAAKDEARRAALEEAAKEMQLVFGSQPGLAVHLARIVRELAGKR